MVKIQLIEPQVGYLDVSENTVFPLTFSVGDIRDLSKRSGTYSKTIQLPATNNNNLLLNSYFDVNVVAGTFDVTRKQKCVVLQNGIAILDNCYLQLLNVRDNEGLIEYEVNIKNNTSDFFQIISNKDLTDLDFSDFNHTLNSTYVDASFSNTSGFKYVLPYFDGNQITVSEALPCFFAKDIFDRIFQSAGYRYDWTTLTDKGIEFDKLLIPYNGEGYDAREQEKVVANDTTLSYPDVNFFTNPDGEDIILTNEVQDDQSRYNPITGLYTSGANFLGDNQLKIVVKASGTATFTNNTGADATNGTADVDINYRLRVIYNGVSVTNALITKINIAPSQTVLNTGSLTSDFNVVIEFPISGVTLGGVLGINVMSWQTINQFGSFGTFTAFSDYDQGIDFDFIEMTIEPTALNLYSGININVNQYIPKKIKQSEFIKSLFQMYNLYADIDPDDSNLLVLNTRDDFYDNGIVKDWTKKLAKNLEIQTQFLPDVSNKKYLLTYKKDSDQTNELYFKNVNEVYGQQEYIFDSEFVRDTQTNEITFSPTPYAINDNNLALSYITGKKPKNNIRVLYDGGLVTGGEYYLNDFVDNDGILENTYPLAIHFDNHLTPSFDLNFGVCDFYFTQLTSLTNNNLYNLHWRRTLGQINAGKLVTAYFNLNELDINTLRLSDKIQVGNTLFNINKIIDYDANSDSLTKVELMTIDADVLLTPFITRNVRDLSRTNFAITERLPNNVVTGLAQVSGNNNNTDNGVVLGDGNQVYDALVIGDNNIGKGIIVGQNNVVPDQFQNAVIVGQGKEVRYENAVTSENVDTEILYVEDTVTDLNHTLRTTNATTTTIYSFTPDDGVYLIETFVNAYRSSTGDSMGVKGFAVFKVIAGVVTQVSTTDTVRKSNFPASVTVLLNTDGTIIRVQVTGLAGATIDWNTNIKIYS